MLDGLTAPHWIRPLLRTASFCRRRLEANAAPTTVRKEWDVLMRIINPAGDFE